MALELAGSERRTFTATIAGQKREVECFDNYQDGGSCFISVEYVALARVGRGLKLWPCQIRFWRDKNDPTVYQQSAGAVHLNRQAVIVAWNDGTHATSRHNSAHRSPAATTRQCLLLASLREFNRFLKVLEVYQPALSLRGQAEMLRRIQQDTRKADGWKWGAL